MPSRPRITQGGPQGAADTLKLRQKGSLWLSGWVSFTYPGAFLRTRLHRLHRSLPLTLDNDKALFAASLKKMKNAQGHTDRGRFEGV